MFPGKIFSKLSDLAKTGARGAGRAGKRAGTVLLPGLHFRADSGIIFRNSLFDRPQG